MRLSDFESRQLISQLLGEQIGNPIFSHTSDYNLLADLIVEDSNGNLFPHWFPSTC